MEDDSIETRAASPAASDASSASSTLRRLAARAQEAALDRERNYGDRREVPPITTFFNRGPLSPRTVAAALEGYPGLDASTLRVICSGLVSTLESRTEQYLTTTNTLNAQIEGLASRVQEYENTFEAAPEGYVENVHFPNLRIPVGNGLYRPVKWVKQGEDGFMYCHTAEDGPRGSNSQPYLIPVYASPITSTDEPIEPFPNWMRAILHGPSAPYLNLLESAKTLDDWGVAADLARYRRCDEELMLIENKIRTLEVERVAMEYNRTIIAARLEASRAAESLAFLEGLAPLPSRRHLEEERTFDPDDQVARPVRGSLRRGRR
jgi:hypothetical protein